MSNDHIALAKKCLAKGDKYYAQAADHIIAARNEGWTTAALAREFGRSDKWVSLIVAWASKSEGPPDSSPFGGEEQNEARYDRQARTILKDPERRQKALSELSAKALDAIRSDATDELIGRTRAQRAEHDTTPREFTVRDLMGDNPFDPSESWIDTPIMRVHTRAHEMHATAKKWGVVLGSLSEDEAYQMLQRAEREIAEVRVVLQERIGDRAQAGELA